MQKVPKILIGLLYLLPLIAVPMINSGFEVPKVLFCEISIILIATYALLNNHLQITKSLSIFLIGVIFLSITTVFFHNSTTVLFNNPIRLQGLFLQGILCVWVILVASYSFSFPSRFAPFIAMLMLFISGVLLQEPITARAVGLVGEPNSYAGMGVLLFIFSFFSWKNKRFGRVYITAAGFFSLLMILFSGSRSGLFAFILACLLLFFVEYKQLSLRIATIMSIGILLLAISLPLFQTNDVWENRGLIWQTALVGGAQQPIIGNGFGNITQSLKRASREVQNNIQYQYVDSSHNLLLDWWVQGGILGLISILFAIIFALKTFITYKLHLEFILLLATLMIMFFNPVSICILAVFWWCIGRGFKTNIEEKRI